MGQRSVVGGKLSTGEAVAERRPGRMQRNLSNLKPKRVTLGLVARVQTADNVIRTLYLPAHSHKSSSAAVGAEAVSGCPCFAGAVCSPG